MKKLITLILFFILINATAQEVITIKTKTPAPDKINEEFQVLKDNPEVKNGSYEKYKNKKIIESGFYKNNQKDSTWNIYSQSGPRVAEGKFKSDVKTGVWNYYTRFGALVQQYDHDKDTLIHFDVSEEKKIGGAPGIYPDTAQEQLPLFIGGMTYMYTLIENNMIYPHEAWKKMKSATVYISFVVDTTGNTTEVKSLRYAGNGFDEEAIKLISSFEKSWIPGRQKGKAVKVSYSLPLKFKLK